VFSGTDIGHKNLKHQKAGHPLGNKPAESGIFNIRHGIIIGRKKQIKCFYLICIQGRLKCNGIRLIIKWSLAKSLKTPV